MIEYVSAEMTITTCRRIDCFMQAVESIYNNLQDIHLLRSITVFDDNSSDADRNKMQNTFPDLKYIWIDGTGHDKSLRQLHKHVSSEFLLTWEDDFVLGTKCNLVQRCLTVLENRFISAVIIRPCEGVKMTDSNGEPYYIKMYDSVIADYLINNRINGFTGLSPSWPGWSANVVFQRVQPLKKLQYPLHPNHEHTFARMYHDAGYRVAHISDIACYHLNKTSAYDLTGNYR